MGTLRLRVLGTPLRASISVGVVAFAVGAGIGFVLGRRPKSTVPHYFPDGLDVHLTEGDLDKMRARNAAKRKKGTVVIPSLNRDVPLTAELGKEFVERKLQVTEAPETPEPEREYFTRKPGERDTILAPSRAEVEVVPHSVFASNDADWNYELELSKRTPVNPYVIHKDEFFSNEFDYSQSTVTFYAGDSILADEDETPMYNHAGVVGEIKFGHGSGDPNVVYIRNDNRKAEYEVLFDPGLFSEEILGLQIEQNDRKQDLQHSNLRKFRPEE